MNCVDEIVSRISMLGDISNDRIRIILNDYDISPKCTEIVLADDDKRQKAIQMFIVTKKGRGLHGKHNPLLYGGFKKIF